MEPLLEWSLARETRAVKMQGITVLAYQPNHSCVLRYALEERNEQGESTGRTVMAKLYGTRQKAAEVYATMQTLWANGFDAESLLTIPQPLAHLADLGMIIHEDLGAPDLSQLLDEPEADSGLRMAAAWLHKLHNTRGVNWNRFDSAEQKFKQAREWCQMLGSANPRWQDHLAFILGELSERLAQSIAHEVSPIQNNFYYAHVHMDKPRLIVDNFDQCTLGDPLFDVGYFWGHLLARSPCSNTHLLTPEAQVFLNAYECPNSTISLARVAGYAAHTCLMLAHALWQQEQPERWSKGEALLVQAKNLLML